MMSPAALEVNPAAVLNLTASEVAEWSALASLDADRGEPTDAELDAMADASAWMDAYESGLSYA